MILIEALIIGIVLGGIVASVFDAVMFLLVGDSKPRRVQKPKRVYIPMKSDY